MIDERDETIKALEALVKEKDEAEADAMLNMFI